MPVYQGLPEPDEIYAELYQYTQVLLGRQESPVHSPYLALQEVATAYLARAYELDMMIHELEDKREVSRNAPYYRIRTGVLRSFIEMGRKMADLGSRRLTQETLLSQQRRDLGEAL